MRVALLAFAAAGCDNAIEMTLVLPDQYVDVSCVDRVKVASLGASIDDVETACVDIAPPAATPRDLLARVRGRVELAIPASGLRALTFVATASGAGACADADDEVVAHGAVAVDGADDGAAIAIPLSANLDCGRRRMSEMVVRPIDLVALVGTPAGAPPACTAPIGADNLALGTIRATMLPENRPGAVFDPITSAPVVDGVARLPWWYDRAEGSSVLAVGARDAASPIDPSAIAVPGACSAAGEVEVAILSASDADLSFDATRGYDNAVFGTVWNVAASPRHPIAGATIAIAAGDAVVTYTDVADRRFAPRLGLSTGPTGTFAVYTDAPVDVVVAAPGYRDRRLRLGVESRHGDGSAAIVGLVPE
jgi:hypothetical protein